MTETPKLGAIAVVVRGAEVLLVQRGKAPDIGTWGFPGGHVELGETALDAAIRELWEETSVQATAQAYLTNVDVIRHDSDGSVASHYLLAAVICDYVAGTPTAGDDARDARWIVCEDLRAGHYQLSPQVLDVMELALAQSAG